MPVKRKAEKATSPSPLDPIPSQVPSTPSSSLQPIKITLYDAGAMRGAMDDLAKEVVLDEGYEEDTSVSNAKIVMGVFLIAVALYSQFGLGKFGPATFYPTLACLALYALTSCGLYLYSYRYEGDSFLMTQPKNGQPSIHLASLMNRCQGDYTLEVSEKHIGSTRPPLRTVQGSWSVGEVFHADGYLAEGIFKGKVLSLMAELKDAARKS